MPGGRGESGGSGGVTGRAGSPRRAALPAGRAAARRPYLKSARGAAGAARCRSLDERALSEKKPREGRAKGRRKEKRRRRRDPGKLSLVPSGSWAARSGRRWRRMRSTCAGCRPPRPGDHVSPPRGEGAAPGCARGVSAFPAGIRAPRAAARLGPPPRVPR